MLCDNGQKSSMGAGKGVHRARGLTQVAGFYSHLIWQVTSLLSSTQFPDLQNDTGYFQLLEV